MLEETTELSPLLPEQYWCSIVIFLPEAKEGLTEPSDHRKTTHQRHNEQRAEFC
jgi:hypothetical protein